MKKLFIFVLSTTLMQSCLETRESAKESEEKQQIQKQVGNLQRSTADVNARFQETDDVISKLSARLDVVDSKVSKSEDRIEKSMAGRDQKAKEVSDKVAVHQEVLTKMDAEITALKAQVAALAEEVKRVPPPAPAASGSNEKNDFKVAEEFFDKKQWQDAAITFEKYRKANPKGKHAAEALYKIGVSFQEMGSKDEAKVFYKDTVSQYPGSTEAKKAATRLKGMK